MATATPARAARRRFAIWLPDENLVLPWVDYVALRVTEGEIVMVPFAAVAGLAGPHGTLLDECQLLVRAISDDEWKDVVARARPLRRRRRPASRGARSVPNQYVIARARRKKTPRGSIVPRSRGASFA